MTVYFCERINKGTQIKRYRSKNIIRDGVEDKERVNANFNGVKLESSSLNVDTALTDQHVLNCVFADMNSGDFISKIYKCLTTNMEMILPSDKSPDLPPHAPVGAYNQRDQTTFLLVAESNGIERSDGDSVSVYER